MIDCCLKFLNKELAKLKIKIKINFKFFSFIYKISKFEISK